METIIQEILSHISVLNGEMGAIQIDIAVLKSQMAQILMYQKIVMGTFLSIVGGMIIFIFRRMFLRIFNNKK